ncbi:MAG: CHAD domain-containing protein, partial [Actinomycetota bacterium]|nr:CHAD domain-containing protein [Actinomycetota bacterium]
MEVDPDPEPGNSIPSGSPDGRFRLTAAQVLNQRSAELVMQSKGVLDVSDPDRAEALWLGARRMRAALEVFRSCVSKSDYRAAREEVTRIARAVGARRDVDAAIAMCEAVGAEAGPHDAEGINRSIDRLRRRQAELNRDLARHIHGRRLQAFKVRTEDLSNYVTRAVTGHQDGDEASISELPPPVIDLVSQRLERLRDLAPKALDPENVRDHHRMRVAAERLRYSLELTAEALGSQAHTARRAARGLQETLTEV